MMMKLKADVVVKKNSSQPRLERIMSLQMFACNCGNERLDKN